MKRKPRARRRRSAALGFPLKLLEFRDQLGRPDGELRFVLTVMFFDRFVIGRQKPSRVAENLDQTRATEGFFNDKRHLPADRIPRALRFAVKRTRRFDLFFLAEFSRLEIEKEPLERP